MTSTRSSPIWLSRARRGGIFIVVLILLYAAFGFLIAPWILKSKVIPAIADRLGRDVSAKEITVNPFALSVTIRGFEMLEAERVPFVAFEEMYINFQMSSIFRRAFTFAEVLVHAPRGQISISPDGRLNFSDLLASSESNEHKVSRRQELPPVLIFHLQVDQGRLVFSDLSRRTPFKLTFSPITLRATGFSTQKNHESRYALAATTDNGEMVHLAGAMSLNPVRAEGRLALTGTRGRTLWEYVQDRVRFEVTDGSIDVAARYSVKTGEGSIDVELRDGELELSAVELGEKNSTDPLLSFPLLSVTGVDVHFTNKEAVVNSVYLKDVRFKNWVDRGGAFQAQHMFTIEDLEQKVAPSARNRDRPDAEKQPWKFTLRELIVEDAGLILENRTFAETLRVTLEPVDITLTNVSNEKDTQATLTLSAGVNDTGTIRSEGVVSINPPSAAVDVQATGIALAAFQPTFATLAQVKVLTGTTDLQGQLKYRASGDDSPEARYEGGARIDGLTVVDREFAEDFIKWESLLLNGVVFDMNPNKLSISEVVAKRSYIKVIIWSDGAVNVTSVLAPPDDQQGDKPIVLVARPFEKAGGPMPVTIETVRFENGSVDFADLSLKPNFATTIQGLEGTIKSLSSEPSARADILLKGRAGKYAPVKIAGQVNPFGENRYADLKLVFRNMELRTVTPYAGKFLGYTIEKGKLSVDLEYELEGSILRGENEILLNKLTLGKRVESPHATTLPVTLVIALLKDRDGNIDLNVPVRGDLSDPEFDYGSLVAKALGKVITKVITSPFALLASLVGGDGEELGFVEFEFGSAILREDQIEKLDKLAQALHERPALRLEITGSADTEYDRTALAEAELLDQLKEIKLKEMRTARAQVPAQSEDISLSDDEYTRLVIHVYEKRFGKHPGALFGIKAQPSAKEGEVPTGPNQSPPTSPAKKREASTIDPAVIATAAKKRLVEDIAIDKIMLRTLAQDRAKHIRDYLIEEGKIQPERLVIAEVEVGDVLDNDTMRIDLSLSGT